MKLLLDTCVVSEFIKRRPDPRVMAWAHAQDDAHLFLSVITVGEVRAGIEQMETGPRRDNLARWLHKELLVDFAGRIVDIDVPTMLRWGEVVGSLKRSGRTPATLDSLIGASALQRGLAIATRNEPDFAALGLTVVNPWR